MPSSKLRHAMPVDVEGDFHDSTYADSMARSRRAAQPWRSAQNVQRSLARPAARQVRATVNGWGASAPRYGATVRPLACAGRQLASDGCQHPGPDQLHFLHDCEWNRIDRLLPVLPSSSAVLHSE